MKTSMVESTRLALALIGLFAVSFGAPEVAQGQTIDPAHLAGLKWRNIGPFRGGRVSAVAGVIDQPDTFYIGLPQSGIWKTTSAGQTWFPVFDAVKEVCSVGSIQVAQSDPKIIYAGTGEISGGNEGDGIYKSSDAGNTWSLMGLRDTKVIPSLLVDPHNPNLVLAAAMGPNNSPSEKRGVFRSTDGGKTWTKPLYIDNGTGVQHLTWAYDNPSTVFAMSWPRYRDPQAKSSPNPEVYKSTDEGVTWKKVASAGLHDITGRITLAVAQGTQSQRLFLIGTFGLYRSDDGGANWRKMAENDSRIANGQGWYSSGVYVSTQNPDVVYTLATCVYRSIDGGKTFEGFKGAPGGDDPHHLWIDPTNANHILLGGDQGAAVSLDAGKTWGTWYNQPTGQVYHISTDTQFPYWVYATQQDSGSIATSSRGNLGAITPFDWLAHPGNEGGFIVADPLNPKVSYAVGPVGGIIRVTYPSSQWVQVEPNLSPTSDLRGGVGQMAFNPTNPHELIMGFQKLVATTDGGANWKAISPNLTEDLAAKTKVEKDQSKDASILNFCASYVATGEIWAGTSNGLIKLTRDHGKSWEDVSLPKGSGGKRTPVTYIEASRIDPGSAYVCGGATSDGESKAPLYRTHDFGHTWTYIGKGLPSPESGGGRVSVVRADAKRAGLLFGITNRTVLVSFDDGDHWQSLNLNLPTTSLSDLTVHDNDLVLGTFGRGIWILDDYSPLREISATTTSNSAYLYKPGLAYRLRRNLNGDTPLPPEVPHAENPPLGAVIYYSLKDKPKGEIRLEILDKHGNVIRHFSSAPVEQYDDPQPLVPNFWTEVRKPLPTGVGLNRINWNVRYDTPPAFNHDVSDVMGAIAGDTPAAVEGPLALPGEYTARLTVDGKSSSQTFTVKNDPRSPSSERDIQLEHPFRMDYYSGIVVAWKGYRQVSELRASIASLLGLNPAPEIAKAAKAFDDKIAAISGTVTHDRRFYGPPSPTTFAGLNGYLLARLDEFDYGDIAPTEPMKSVYASDWLKLKTVSDKWRDLQRKELVELNSLLTKVGMQPISAATPPLVDPPAPEKRYLPKPQPPAKAAMTKIGS